MKMSLNKSLERLLSLLLYNLFLFSEKICMKYQIGIKKTYLCKQDIKFLDAQQFCVNIFMKRKYTFIKMTKSIYKNDPCKFHLEKKASN